MKTYNLLTENMSTSFISLVFLILAALSLHIEHQLNKVNNLKKSS